MANGCEKIVHLEMGLRLLNSDVHSADAAIIPSAAWRVVWALGTMKDEDGNVLIAGLCGNEKAALNIVGLNIGYSGAGSKTIVPASAYCRIDVSPAQGLGEKEVLAKIRAHLDAHGFADVRVKIC